MVCYTLPPSARRFGRTERERQGEAASGGMEERKRREREAPRGGEKRKEKGAEGRRPPLRYTLQSLDVVHSLLLPFPSLRSFSSLGEEEGPLPPSA